MKHIVRFTLILPPLLIAGFIMLVAGGETFSPVGRIILTMVVPGLMFIGVAAGLILAITGKLFPHDPEKTEEERKETESDPAETENAAEQAAEEQPMSEKEKELSAIADVNSSHGFESKVKSSMYVADHAAEKYEKSSPKQKILTWMLFTLLIGAFGLMLVFVFLRHLVGALVCAGIFAGTILIAIISMVIIQKMSMGRLARRKKNSIILSGEVTDCQLSSTTETGSGRYHSTQRITSVVYEITVGSGGREYKGYSHEFFETGESVTFVARGNLAADILTDEMLRAREEEQKNKAKK